MSVTLFLYNNKTFDALYIVWILCKKFPIYSNIFWFIFQSVAPTLRENYPNTEFFLVFASTLTVHWKFFSLMSAQGRNYWYEKVCVFDHNFVEFFLVRIFPYSDQKYLRIRILFTPCKLNRTLSESQQTRR